MAAVIKPPPLSSFRLLLRYLSSSVAPVEPTCAAVADLATTAAAGVAAATTTPIPVAVTTTTTTAATTAAFANILTPTTATSTTPAAATTADSLSPAESKLLDRFHTLIKNHHRTDPTRTPSPPPPTLTIPSLSADFSKLSPTPFSPSLARLLISRCAASSRTIPFPQTLAFFNWYLSTSSPSPLLFTQMIDLAGKLHHFPICYHLLDTMRSLHLPIPFPAFSALIRRLVRAGLPSEAADAFHRMPDYGLDPTPAALSSLIAALSKKRLAAEAQSLFNATRLPPDVVTYSALANAWCRAGRIDEAERVFREMKENKIPPNVYTYTAVIEAMCRAGQISCAHELLCQMIDEKCPPNAATFNSFLRAHVKAGRTEQALQVLNQMRQLACEPDIISYNFIIEAHCIKGQSNLEAALKVLNQMLNKGCTPDVYCFNHIFRCILDIGDFPAAQPLHTKMMDLGCKPNIVTYNLLIQLFSKDKSMDALLKMKKAMEEAGLEPNLNTYKVLISAFCERGSWKRVYFLTREMLEEKCFKPTVPVFEQVSLLLRKAGQLTKLDELEKKMEERGFMARPM